jgi:EpsG family
VSTSAPRFYMATGQLPLPTASRSAMTYALTALMVLHAALRGLQSDLDASIYAAWYTELGTLTAQDFFDRLRESGWIFQAREQVIARFESGFSLLSWWLASSGLPVSGYFAVIAALSLFPKAYVALRFTPYPMLSMLWYGSYCYLLLEMNAMRAGLAAALMLIAVLAMLQRRWLVWLLLLLLASTFHSAALVGLLLPLVSALARHPWYLAFLVLASVGLSVVDVTAVLGVLGGAFEKIADYKAAFDAGFGDVAYLRLNPVNSSSLAFMAITAMFCFSAFSAPSDKAMLDRKATVILLLPLMSLFAFSSFPIVGGRLSELLCVYQMLFVTWLVDRYPSMGLGRAALVVTMSIQFSIQQFLTLHVDALYFLGAPRQEMLLLIEQKSVIDAVLAEILTTLQ